MRFEMKDPLGEGQWEAIEGAAYEIIERTGFEVEHGEVREALSGKRGVRVEGNRVLVEREVVREGIRGMKGCEEAYDTPLVVGAYSHNFMEVETLAVRRATLADLVKSLREAEALGQGACAPVVPLDVSGARQELVMERVTHENVRYSYGGGQATTRATAEATIEMSAVVGRPHALELWVTSPLKMDPLGLDIVWKLRHRRPHVRIISSPVRGMTGPISLAGILAQSAAECFGAAALLRMLGIAESVTYRTDAFVTYPVEMRSANVLVSGPDYLRQLVLSIFFARRHGIEGPMGKALLTMSKEPDGQAAAEKLAQGLASKLAGAGTFTAGGALAGVETYSPVQMVIDLEIVRWIEATMRPLDFIEDDFLLDVVDRVGPGGTFLDEESTVNRFREEFWRAGLFSYSPMGTWLAEGKRTLVEKARETLSALELRDEPIVSREAQRELARIEERFAAQL